MKTMVKKVLRKYCPNISFIRNVLKEKKIKEFEKYTMEETDIFRGENSWTDKMAVVKKYSLQWPQYAQKLRHLLEEYFSKSGVKGSQSELENLKAAVLFDCFAYGFLPDEYFAYHLGEKNAAEKKMYLSNRDKDIFSYRMNDIIDMDIFLDKAKTYHMFQKYYKRDAIAVARQSDLDMFKNFVKKHPVFVCKNVMLSRGDSVKIVDIRTEKQSVENIFENMLAEGKHIVEERIVQSAYMSQLSLRSVNTVRCMTFLSGQEVKIGPCFLKVGQGNSFIDNGAAGGILIGINNDSGKLETAGYDEFLVEYERHPDTNVVFKQFFLPEWDNLKKLAVELAAKVPTVRYVGWDLAHTDEGWIVVEGNASGQFIGPQIVWQRGFREDIEKLIK